MTRPRRSLLIVLGTVVALLLAAAALLQDSTRQALERAEAFRFRRMLVTRLEDQSGYRFFFATNREPSGVTGPLEDGFASE